MADPITQRLVRNVVEQMRCVAVANGYRTNAGRNVTNWRTTEFQDTELPGIDIRDTFSVFEEAPQPRVHQHKRRFEFRAVIKGGDESAELARQLEADIWKAIKEDRTWGGIAFNTLPVRSMVGVDQEDKTVGHVLVEIDVQIRHPAFDFYS